MLCTLSISQYAMFGGGQSGGGGGIGGGLRIGTGTSTGGKGII